VDVQPAFATFDSLVTHWSGGAANPYTGRENFLAGLPHKMSLKAASPCAMILAYKPNHAHAD